MHGNLIPVPTCDWSDPVMDTAMIGVNTLITDYATIDTLDACKVQCEKEEGCKSIDWMDDGNTYDCRLYSIVGTGDELGRNINYDHYSVECPGMCLKI